MLHASEPLGHHYPGKGTATPERLLKFVSAQPRLTIVFAHWGGGLPFYELMPEVAAVSANVLYDTAASTYLYRPTVFRAVLDVVGAERVMWGSDHPVLGMKRFLRRTLQDANLTEHELQRVLAGNAARVYFLPEIT
jgi:predicted TIM-barrel fold metal-dependent hydrolase